MNTDYRKPSGECKPDLFTSVFEFLIIFDVNVLF